jgi:hypothetical protein
MIWDEGERYRGKDADSWEVAATAAAAAHAGVKLGVNICINLHHRATD